MSQLVELETLYKNADSFKLQLDFIKKLLESNDSEIINYHYSLLKEKKDVIFFQQIRASFKKRGKAGIHFLLEKLKSEYDIALKSEALFIIGAMKGLDSQEVSTIKVVANKFIDEKYNYNTQYYGIIVLGWIGKKEEIEILSRELSKNNNEKLRDYSASALRQIWYNNKKLKKQILKVYFKSLENEESVLVNSTIIACTQDLLQRKFGIKESQYGQISGDVDKAKPKSLKALQKELA